MAILINQDYTRYNNHKNQQVVFLFNDFLVYFINIFNNFHCYFIYSKVLYLYTKNFLIYIKI
jgi:hypothetical protein